MTKAVADPQECRDFLAAHPQVRYVDVFFTSMTGVPRGKRLRVHELQAIYDYGRFLPGSILVVDTLGADCEETGLVWEDGDADRRARPVPGTLTLAPWLGPDMAQVMLSLYELVVPHSGNGIDPTWHRLLCGLSAEVKHARRVPGDRPGPEQRGTR